MTKCYDQFCLYSDFKEKLYNRYTYLDQVCNNLENQWLIELYNPSVQSNVDDFLRINYNTLGYNKVVPINLRLITLKNEWTWITGEKANETIDEQEAFASQFAYLIITSLKTSIHAAVATSLRSVICMLKGNCPVNVSSSWFYSNMCYFSIERLLNWYDAINTCSSYNANLGSFMNILSKIDTNWLRNLQSNNYWIGLRRSDWIWKSTSQSVTYFNWYNGYPDVSVYNQPYSDYFYNFNTYFDKNNWMTVPNTQSDLIVICMSNNPNFKTTATSIVFPTTPTSPMNLNDVSKAIYTTSTSVYNSSMSSTPIGLTIGLAVGIPVFIILVVAAILAIYFFRKKHNLNGRLASFPHEQRFGTLMFTIGSFLMGELSKRRPDLQPFPPPVDDQRESPYAEPISLDQCVDGDIYGTVVRGLAKSKDNDLFYPQLVWKKDMNSIYANGDLMGGDANNGDTTRDEQKRRVVDRVADDIYSSSNS